jgi:hypothetical protein
MKSNDPKIAEFILQSNYIEGERKRQAFLDAMDAWAYIARKKRITLDDVLIVHKILMGRKHPRIAGYFRRCDVWIGGEVARFVSWQDFSDRLKPILEAMNRKESEGTYSVVEAKMLTRKLHIEFERIHPFEDGNGRVGRILWQWHRLKLGLPVMVIHEGDEQYAYYDWFKKESKGSFIDKWYSKYFFLDEAGRSQLQPSDVEPRPTEDSAPMMSRAHTEGAWHLIDGFIGGQDLGA